MKLKIHLPSLVRFILGDPSDNTLRLNPQHFFLLVSFSKLFRDFSSRHLNQFSSSGLSDRSVIVPQAECAEGAGGCHFFQCAL
jgi:hypothetical protein